MRSPLDGLRSPFGGVFGRVGGLSLRDQIEALRYDLTTNGVTPGTTLKVPGVDALPTGATYNAGTKTVTVSGAFAGDVFDSWDFTDLQVTVQGPVTAFENCKFGETLSTPSGVLRYVDLYTSGSIGEFDRCTFEGPYTFGGVGEAVAARSTGTGVSYVAAQIGRYNRCRFVGLTSDALKLNGATATGGQIVEWCYFGAHVNLPNEPTLWSAGTTYALNQAVSRADGFVYLSKSAGNVGNALPSGGSRTEENTFWKGVDPHADHLTTVSAVGNGITVRFSLFDNTDNPPGAFGPYPSLGINNALRVSRNSGTDFPVNLVRFESNVLYRAPGEEASFPIQVDEGVGTNFNGPVQFVGNWLAANASGFYFHPTSNDWVDVWSDNRDYTTDAVIAGPTLRVPLDPPLAFTLMDGFEALGSRTVSAGASLSITAPVVQGAGALLVDSNGVTNPAAVNPDLGIGEAPTAWDMFAVMIDLGPDSWRHGSSVVRPTITKNGVAFPYQVDTGAGAGQPQFADQNTRGKKWFSFAASSCRQTNFAGANLTTGAAGITRVALDLQQLTTSHRDTQFKVDALVRPTRHKTVLMFACDDVNAPQRTTMADILQARGFAATGFAAMSLFGTGAKLTLAQALELKNTYGWEWALNSGPSDEPFIGFSSVANSIAQLNSHRDSLITSGLGSAASAQHLVASYGFFGYSTVSQTLTITGNGTTTITGTGAQIWSGGVCAGMVVKNTGVTPNPTVVNTPTQNTAVLSAAGAFGSRSVTFCGNQQGLAVTCNGTAIIACNTTGLVPGQRMVGAGVPEGTNIVSVDVESTSGQITVSQNVPSTCAIASFFLLSGEFGQDKMQDALIAAGYKTCRRAFAGGVYTGYGFDPLNAFSMPSINIEKTTDSATLEIANIDDAIRNGRDAYLFTHFTPTQSVPHFIAVCDYVKAQVDLDRCDVLTVSPWWDRVSRRSPFPG
jgi:hypothetical protein